MNIIRTGYDWIDERCSQRKVVATWETENGTMERSYKAHYLPTILAGMFILAMLVLVVALSHSAGLAAAVTPSCTTP